MSIGYQNSTDDIGKNVIVYLIVRVSTLKYPKSSKRSTTWGRIHFF